MQLKSRDTQTEVKHQILSKYLDTWGGIILNPGMRSRFKQSRKRSDLHFVYVDCFSYVGRYAGDKHRSEEVVFGSPVIGIRCLDKLAESAKKDVDLQFPEMKRTIFYLFLTTHDPTGALALNKTLYEAKLFEHEIRYRRWFAKKTAPPPHQLKFDLPPEIDLPKVPEPTVNPRPTTEEIAQEILSRFQGQTVTRRDIYRELADDIFFSDEVDKALRHLRKQGDAKFDSNLTHNTSITFANR